MFQTRIIKKQLHFKQPAGTSRGVYTTRNVWYILLTDTGSRHYGVGECAPLPALSCDDIPSYDEVLATACKNLEKNGEIDREALLPYPSILFGMETALLHFRARSLQFWHTPFSKAKRASPSTDSSGWETLRDVPAHRGKDAARLPLHQTQNRRHRL